MEGPAVFRSLPNVCDRNETNLLERSKGMYWLIGWTGAATTFSMVMVVMDDGRDTDTEYGLWNMDGQGLDGLPTTEDFQCLSCGGGPEFWRVQLASRLSDWLQRVFSLWRGASIGVLLGNRVSVYSPVVGYQNARGLGSMIASIFRTKPSI